jgi:hypothetical protein
MLDFGGKKFPPIPRDKKFEDLTEEEKLRVSYARSIVRYHNCVKILREAHSYLKTFDRDEEYLYGDESHMIEWIKEDSDMAFKEAFYDVKVSRETTNDLKRQLMDNAAKKRN